MMPSIHNLARSISSQPLRRSKLLLCALTCALAMPMVFGEAAIAGSTAVTPNDSGGAGISDSFAPATTVDRASIEVGTLDVLRVIEERLFVSSADGERISISPTAVSAIRTSLQTGRRAGLESALSQLEQQISDEIGFALVEISRVSNSPADVRSAVISVNRLINNLNSQQLAAASQSPTFLAVLQLLRNANAMLNSDADIDFNEEDDEFGLIRLGSPIVSR